MKNYMTCLIEVKQLPRKASRAQNGFKYLYKNSKEPSSNVYLNNSDKSYMNDVARGSKHPKASSKQVVK